MTLRRSAEWLAEYAARHAGFRTARQVGASIVDTSSMPGAGNGRSLPSAVAVPGTHQRAKADSDRVCGGHLMPVAAASSTPLTAADSPNGNAGVGAPSPSSGRDGARSAVVLPWPPTGNTSVRHANGAHYLTRETRVYRILVAEIMQDVARVVGRYTLRVHMSPPDRRARDIDNALKGLFDAIVQAGYVESDSMTYMRELWVTVDDERRGEVTVEAVAA